MTKVMQKNESQQPRRQRRYNSIDGFISPRVKQQPPAVNFYRSSQLPVPASSKPSIPNNLSAARPKLPPQQTRSLLNKTISNSTSPSMQRNEQPADSNPLESTYKRKHGIKRQRSKWSWKRRIVVLLALILVAALGLGGWDAWQLDHKVNHLAVGNLTASVGGAENILVAGSTNRCNLKVQNAEWGFCSQGVTGVNSDIIFIIHVVPKTHAVTLLSIPRDTFVPNARAGNEAFKIDAALYEGPSQLVSAVEEDFGIPIQHYVEVGFDGFVNIVNAVGGIKMDFPMPVYDSESYLNIKTPGCQLLNGVEALQVVRARHLQYDPPSLHTSNIYLWPQEVESDIARINRTHEFLRVIASTVTAKGLGNPITDQKLIDAIAPQVQVDNGLSTAAMLQLAEEFHAVNIDNVPQYTLPISTTDFTSYIYNGTNYGEVVFPAEVNDQQVINEFLGVSNSTDTMSGHALPKPGLVTVNVINGSGTPNQATQTTAALQALGFKVIGEPGSATPLSSQTVETVVNYAGPETEAAAESVARQLTGPVILSQDANMITAGSDVTVLTGTGLSVNAPASSSSTAPTAGPSAQSSSSPSSATANTGLQAPTLSTQALSAWDPRACTE